MVEIAFGRLKTHWCRLAKKLDIHIDIVPHIIAACCVLHSVCEIHHKSFNEEWLQEVDLDIKNHLFLQARGSTVVDEHMVDM